ncbi:MAG: hypothetical protein ACXVLQ_18655, partial [Bacteriovorax sp.]
MKKLILLSMAICTLSVSAGEYTHSLTGENAKKMFKILNSAGIPSTKFGTKTTLEAYDVFCIGQNYQNVCYVSTEGSDPASSRLDIYG